MRIRPFVLLFLGILPLGGCTLEGFDVTPCQAGETVGFAIAPIEGVFSDYQPRPSELWIRASNDRDYREAVVWAARLPYTINGDNSAYDTRPSRKLIIYGEQLPRWNINHSKPLAEGQTYSAHFSDGGHNGWAEFKYGKPLPACPR
jgi:hypothetical protein